MMPFHWNSSRMASIAYGNFLNAPNVEIECSIVFVLLIVSVLWQEHQDEHSESLMTTDDPIELTSKHSTNWQQLYFRQQK